MSCATSGAVGLFASGAVDTPAGARERVALDRPVQTGSNVATRLEHRPRPPRTASDPFSDFLHCYLVIDAV